MRPMRRGLVFALLIVLFSALSAGQVSAASKSRVIIYANNSDDDTLKVGIYVDETYRRGKWLDSGGYRYISYYYLEPGEHEVKIVWSDPDVCESSYEKTFTFDIEKGETKRLVVSTDRNDEIVTCAVKELPCEFTVVVKNLDDDDLWIEMLLDKYSRIKEVRSGLRKSYGTYRLREGEHTVTLKWYEPDAYTMRSKTETIDLEPGKTRETYYVDRHTLLAQEYTGFLKDM